MPMASKDLNGTSAVIHEEQVGTLATTVLVLSIPILLVCYLGNGLILMLVSKTRTLRTRSNALICSLSVCDLLIGLLIAPFCLLSWVQGKWTLSKHWCACVGYLTFLLVGTAMTHHGALALIRYMSIVHPSKMQCNRKWMTVAMVIAVWALPFSILIVSASFTSAGVDFDPKRLRCSIRRNPGSEFVSPVVLAGTLTMFVVIAVCYFCIFITVRRSRRRIRQNASALTTTFTLSQQNQTEIKLCKICLLIFVIFFVSYTPAAFLNMADDTWATGSIPMWAHIIVISLYWVSSGVNPLVYACVYTPFREACHKLLFSRCK